MRIPSHPMKKRGTYPKPTSTQPICFNMFIDRLDGDMNHTLLSTNTDGNITDPEFLSHIAEETNQDLECMK